jgi:hypothetical protein
VWFCGRCSLSSADYVAFCGMIRDEVGNGKEIDGNFALG